MRRSDAVKKLMHKIIAPTEIVKQEHYESGLYEERAEKLLTYLEKDLGMKPPRLDEDRCQAIMRVYYGGYSFNQWDEDFEKDAEVVKAYDKIVERKNKTVKSAKGEA